MLKLRLLMLYALPVEATAAAKALPATTSIPASLTIAGVYVSNTKAALLAATVAAFKWAKSANAAPKPANGTNPVVVAAAVPVFAKATMGLAAVCPNIVAAFLVKVIMTVICPKIDVSIIFVLPSKNDSQLLTL